VLSARLRRFAAWAPGLEDAAAWEGWSRVPAPIGAEGSPEARFVPPMLRRRCTALSKAMLQVAFETCPEDERAQVRTVFASRHGENKEAFPLFSAIAHAQPLSPTKFTHTVHNAQAGLFSIAAGNREGSSSLSAEADTFACGYLEALTHLEREPERAVLYVIGDVPVAPLFQHLTGEPPWSYAVGLLLAAPGPEDDGASGGSLGFALSHRLAPAAAEPLERPHALEFVRWLHAGTEPSLTLAVGRRAWTWTRS
jgi:hypothetical protein